MLPRWPADQLESPSTVAHVGVDAATWTTSNYCEVCDKRMLLRQENDYHCEGCSTIMCKGCFEKVECVVCRNEDDSENPTYCGDCMHCCQACGGATVHPWCKLHHLKTCILTRQSGRSYLPETVVQGDDRREARQRKRKLMTKENDLKDAKKIKGKVPRRLHKV
jgi:hypothetical protein